MTFIPDIDLFASRFNAKFPKFVSWHPEPGTMAVDAFRSLRGNGPNDFVSKLFISYIEPHKPISTDTLSRWIKLVLASAGIDTSVFKAHNVRGAATSQAYAKGVPIAEILRAADWTNERTFRKYYLRQCNPQG